MAISSVPAQFTLTAYPPHNPYTVTFPIPAGVYTGASWQIQGMVTNELTQTIKTGGLYSITTLSGILHGNPGYHASGAYDSGLRPSSSDQLADINLAAGGDLSVDVTDAWFFSNMGTSDHVTLFYLYLIPEPAPVVPPPDVPPVTPPTPDPITSSNGALFRIIRRPYPHSAAAQEFITISFPAGYVQGLDLDVSVGPLAPVFVSVRPESACLGRVVGSVLVMTDRAGVELVDGTVCGDVHIWRYRYSG